MESNLEVEVEEALEAAVNKGDFNVMDNSIIYRVIYFYFSKSVINDKISLMNIMINRF